MPAKATVKKAAVKTQKTKASVAQFLAGVADAGRRADAKAVDALLREVSGERPAMWGPSIVGYGTWQQTNTMGQSSWPKLCFSPRKGATVLYLAPELLESHPLMSQLGRYKNGKSCLYISRLSDVDLKVLRELAKLSWEHVSRKYG